MQIGIHRMKRIFLSMATAGALVFVAAIASATQDVVLTAVKGDTSVQDRALGERTALADDEKLQTGDDSGCSVLLDRSAVVELCADTRITFAKDPRRGNRIVNVESGALRLVVEPRDENERIEIHTPAAIATILGTVVYISVDPQTGATTISSSESRVNIRARDEQECTPHGLPAEPGIPTCAKGTTIGDLEQLTVKAGEQQQPVKQLSQQQIDELGGCLLDFHDLALTVDRRSQETKTAERIAEFDIAVVEIPGPEPIESTSPHETIVETESESETEVEVELTPIDDRDQIDDIIDDLIMDDLPDPPCSGIPGEHCDSR